MVHCVQSIGSAIETNSLVSLFSPIDAVIAIACNDMHQGTQWYQV